MILRWLLAAAHLLAFGIGFGAVWARARGLRGVARGTDPGALRRALVADNWWGVAAVLWIATGLWRFFGGTEKPPTYYYANHLFWTKMALFAAVFVLEIAPMISLIRWRIVLARGGAPDLGRAGQWARISQVQTMLIVLLLLAATAMARGFGA